MRRTALAALLLLGAVACGDTTVGSVSEEPRTILQVRSAETGVVLREVELAPTAGATEPVLAGDVVLVTTRAGLTAFDLKSGEARWTEPDAQLPAAVAGDVVVVDGRDGYTARRADGTVLWRQETAAGAVQAWEGQGVVLLDDGSPPALAPCAGQTNPCVPRPAARSGSVSLIDPLTGAARWTTRLGCRPDANSSVLSTEHALVGCNGEDGRALLTALSLADGSIAWTWAAARSISRSAAVGDAPAVLVDAGSGSQAHGLDPATGRERWRLRTDGLPQRYAPLLDKDQRSGFLRDPRTGERSTGSVASAYGLGAHDGLLVGADIDRLRAVLAADGREVWSSPLPAGPRPITHLDVDGEHVVTITSVGQEEYRD